MPAQITEARNNPYRRYSAIGFLSFQFLDAVIQIPAGFLQILQLLALIRSAADIFEGVAQGEVHTLIFDEIDDLDLSLIVVGGMVDLFGGRCALHGFVHLIHSNSMML